MRGRLLGGFDLRPGLATIPVTTLNLALATIPNWSAAEICVAPMLVIYRWKSKAAIPVIMLSAGIAGALLFA